MAAGPKSKLWQLDPHTLAKHEILRRYLSAWFPIMSKYNRRLILFDGFAGPGVYESGELGSPVIALRALIEHKMFSEFSRDREYVFLFCEADKARFDSLQNQLAAFEATLPGGKWPAGVTVQYANRAFDSTAGELLDHLESKGSRLAPTFAFVDPFGVSGLPMGLLSRLVQSPKCELFVNMIINTAKRFASSGLIDGSLAELYGTDQFQGAAGLTGRDRVLFLHDLYADQLRSQAKMDHVQAFEMVNLQGHTSYFLFYATRDVTGLRAMKEAMWRADPGGGYRFADRLVGQDVLFSEDDLLVAPLRTALLQAFAGREVDVIELERYVLTETPYRETHLRRPVLTPWEKDGTITVIREPKRRQYPPGTRIRFPDRSQVERGIWS